MGWRREEEGKGPSRKKRWRGQEKGEKPSTEFFSQGCDWPYWVAAVEWALFFQAVDGWTDATDGQEINSPADLALGRVALVS